MFDISDYSVLFRMLENVWWEFLRIARPMLSSGMLAVVLVKTADLVTPEELDDTWRVLTTVISVAVLLLILIKAMFSWRTIGRVTLKDAPNVTIEVRIGDLFHENGQIVVGINSNLVTTLSSEGGPIEDLSVQGQFTNKYFESSNEFKEFLAPTREKWKDLGILNTDDALGEVIVFRKANQRTVLVAVATLENGSVSVSSASRIEETTTKMWEHMRGEIAMESNNPVICPLIGAKYVKAPGLTPEKLLKHHIRSFATATRSRLICQRVVFLIGRHDIGHLDTESVREFLVHECSYETLTRNPQPRNPSSKETEGTQRAP